jgi:hypothetical protein
MQLQKLTQDYALEFLQKATKNSVSQKHVSSKHQHFNIADNENKVLCRASQ